jgi:hypothetical protein
MCGKYIATIIANDRPTIRAMNPTTWIKSTNYPELEFAPSLRALRSSVPSCWRSCAGCRRQAGHVVRRRRAPEGHTNGQFWTTRGGSNAVSDPT